MKKRALLLYCFIFFVQVSYGYVDTIFIYSNAMHRQVKAIVIKPADYWQEKKFPVVYLLHGAFGKYSNWITKVPALEGMANQYHMLIVCPDGADNSWYFDSPVDSTYRFETHVAFEVPQYIDAHYKTIADRAHRAIAGLSMGGHGAFFLAFRHAEIFGACGSMSGALNVSGIKDHYDLGKRLGDSVRNAHYYNDWSVIKIIEKYPKDSLAIIFDCGLDDSHSAVNRAVHEKLVQMKIPHDYIERPGGHNWIYWANAVKYQLLFFHDFFSRKN